MTRRRVYLSTGDAHTAAGAGLAPLIAACLKPAPLPPRADGIPYFHAQPLLGSPEARLHELARGVLDTHGMTPERRRAAGVFLGTSSARIGLEERQLDADPQRIAVPHPYLGDLAEQLALALGLHGPRQTITTACSASANALLYAAWMIREGLLDDALVVGVEFANRLSRQGFGSLMLVAPERCRPFDRRRAGVVLGESIAALTLSAQAPEQGWEILGGGTLCDTSHPTSPAPGKIADTLRMALDDAGLAARDIVAVKAHGTGTPSNDLAEGQGIRAVLGDAVPFTSIKPVFGHTLGACGVVETLAYTGCLDAGYLPATGGFEEADPEIVLAPLRHNAPAPRGAVLCNYFGFGGNNCTLALRPC